MRRRHLTLLLLLSACALPQRSSPPYTIESLTFTGPGFRAVELDGYGTARGPHWPFRSQPPLVAEDVPEYYRLHGPPVAYLVGSRMAADIVARVPWSWRGEVTLRGGPFRGAGEAVDGVVRAHVIADDTLPAEVVKRARWRVSWEASFGGARVSLGTSSASLYTLLDEPKGPVLHTALEFTTESTKSTEKLIADVWANFSKRDVRRARDGRALKYYGEFRDGAPAELRRMLISGTGQCVAWAYLLYAALAAHGVDAAVVGVYPPEHGRLYIQPWRFIDGTRFVEAGANGVVETSAAGDDVAYIGVGRGVPHARIWTPEPLPIGRLSGDDTLAYMVGENGIAESFIDTAFALPLLARGFGLEMQRAYEVTGSVTPRGDDIVANGFLLTGANGVLETERQPGMTPVREWEPVVGRGATNLRVQAALPRGWHVDHRGGDDYERDWLHTTGENGVSETRGALYGQGRPHAVAIGAGANGRIDSTPGGDDRTIDLQEFAPADYVSPFNLWPLRGARAQHNDWPPADFPNHVLVKVDGMYYDPSYGAGPFESELAWERAQLAGVGMRVQRGDQVVRVGEDVAYAVRRQDGRTLLARYVPMRPPN